MKKIITLVLLCSGFVCHAQSNVFEIKGYVIEASSQKALDYASVIVKHKQTGDIITGTTTSEGGSFSIDVEMVDVEVEVSFIGLDIVLFDEVVFKNNIADLGEIRMLATSESLDEIVISTSKSTTEFKLDKRVFNVGTDLSSTGTSALEVLNNVPSVNVNIEGVVSLRGATGVQILVNGKPSILADDASNALGTITADMIEKIEVITNPSAKYEAEGTAGIINIVLKKNEKKGINGSVSINTGWPHNHSLGFSLNRRTEKFNLFTQLGAGYRELPRYMENNNIDKTSISEIYSMGTEFRNENFYNLVLGSDYYIDPQNVITLSGSFAYEVEDQPSATHFSLSQDEILQSEWIREELTKANNPKLQYELQYKRDFKDFKEHKLLFSAIGRFFGKDQSSTFSNRFVNGQAAVNDQITQTSFQEGKYTFNLDYSKPFSKEWSIETGTQYLSNDVSNDFSVSNKIGGNYIPDFDLTNVFEYNQKVLGVYSTGSYEGKTWGVKLGVRVEHTDLKTWLVNTNEINSQRFTNLFPSAHTSYKVSELISFQAGYSKRIYRPRLWDLNPFFNIRNNFSVRQGNPNLQPEYTDSYEIGSIFIFDKLSLNINGYYRFTIDKIERVFSFENNVNTVRPENVGTNRAPGVELNFKYLVSKKLSLNGDANYNVFHRKGRFNEQNFDFSADQWTGKLTAKYKIIKAVDIEFTANHQSRERTIQGVISSYSMLNGGLRIKILKGKGVFNIGARDIFASRIREATIDNENYFINSNGRRGRFLTLGFSYGFGKGEAMHFSGRRR